MSPKSGAARQISMHGESFHHTSQNAQLPQIREPARKINFFSRGFLSDEPSAAPAESERSLRDKRTFFDKTSSPRMHANSPTFEDRVAMASLLTESPANDSSGEFHSSAKKSPARRSNQFFDIRAPKTETPSWIWTLISFGACGTACGAVIFGQGCLGMPISPAIWNLGASVFVAGCMMFAAAGAFALKRKRALVY